MRTVYIAHGFNVWDKGKKTTDRLVPFFNRAGFKNVIEVDTFWRGLIGVRFLTPQHAKNLAKIVEPGSIFVGHSDGCNLGNQAAWLGAQFSQMIYINPALDKEAELAPHVLKCHVWYSPKDTPVRIAKWIPFHPWGQMGATGYTGEDTRYINYNKSDAKKYQVTSTGHSDVFSWGKIKYFAPKIITELNKWQKLLQTS